VPGRILALSLNANQQCNISLNRTEVLVIASLFIYAPTRELPAPQMPPVEAAGRPEEDDGSHGS